MPPATAVTADRPGLTGFLHAGDGALLDGAGAPLTMRGVGLGNWLLPEGYMWCLPTSIDSPRLIEALVERRIGPVAAARFWERFRDRFVTHDDVRSIEREGFDHVRLPINWRVVMDDGGAPVPHGLSRIDDLVAWCRAEGLLVVLDLHAAPGGQTGANIDDAPVRRPQLYEVEEYRELAIRLWTILASRYRDESAIAGYDLLNEPLTPEYRGGYDDRVVAFYRDLTEAVRAVDPHHLLIYEGTVGATDWNIFTEVWDPNSMLSFHRYWLGPDRHSIRPYLEARDRLGLPIYMGEGGENNVAWMQTAFQLYDEHDISWNLWPWKKIDTRTSPCSIDPPDGWPDALVDGGRASALTLLDELLDRVPVDRCTRRSDVINAVLRRAPLHLPAVGFSFRGSGRSHRVAAPSPHPDFRADDDVTIRHTAGRDRPIAWDHTDGRPRSADERLVVDLQPGDWLAYDVRLDHGDAVAVVLATEGDDEPLATVSLDGRPARVETAGSVTRHVLDVTGTGTRELVVQAGDALTLTGLHVTAGADGTAGQ